MEKKSVEIYEDNGIIHVRSKRAGWLTFVNLDNMEYVDGSGNRTKFLENRQNHSVFVQISESRNRLALMLAEENK